MQNWCRSDKSAYEWPDPFHPFHATQYALQISCFAFFNIVNVSFDVSLTQNVLNKLFIVIFLAFSSWMCKGTGDGQFCYFQRFVVPLKTRLRYLGFLYKKEEWSYFDFWQAIFQTYPQLCLFIMANLTLLHLKSIGPKIRKKFICKRKRNTEKPPCIYLIWLINFLFLFSDYYFSNMQRYWWKG